MNHKILYPAVLLLCSASVTAKISGAPEAKPMEQTLVLTECEAPLGVGQAWRQLSAVDHAGGLGATSDQLRLVRRGRDYDLLLRRGDEGSWRAADAGKIEIASADGGTFHLVLHQPDGPQHLLFLIDTEGRGDLVWSSATASTATGCMAAARD